MATEIASPVEVALPADAAPDASQGHTNNVADAVVVVDTTPTSQEGSIDKKVSEVDVLAQAGAPSALIAYFQRWRGVTGKQSPPLPKWQDVLWAFIASFAGIAILAALHYSYPLVSERGKAMLIGSFGATAVLVYGVPAAPLAQPRNVVVGHMLSALVGVIVRKVVMDTGCNATCEWLASALAVSLSIAAMMATGTTHPPGGATALIAVTGDATILSLGFLYILIPVGIGALIMLLVALIVNNLAHDRPYPQYWW